MWSPACLIIFVFLLSLVSPRKPTLWRNGNYTSLFNLTKNDLTDFMEFKEEQYTKRKLYIREKCQEYRRQPNQHVSQYSIDPQRGQMMRSRSTLMTSSSADLVA